MKLITLRRIKTQVIDGRPIIDLPPKEDRVQILELNTQERAGYEMVRRKADSYFSDLQKKGLLLSNYVHVLEAILRMRQAASHQSLIKDDSWMNHLLLNEDSGQNSIQLSISEATSTYELLCETGDIQCVSCGSSVECVEGSAYISPCGHLFCRGCSSGNQITCSACHNSFSNEAFRQLNNISGEYEPDFMLLPEIGVTSTKIQTLILDLMRVREEDPTVKSIVFSQWTNMLKLVSLSLQDCGIRFVQLDGSMSRANRMKSMTLFKNAPEIRVFLISLKAGGVGLNLVRASRAYILEPYWNPAVEQQAIDRIHRLGQTRPVVAVRFIVKNTVEENMLKLQKHKTRLAQIAFEEGEEGGKKRKSSSKEELKTERLLSLKMLLGSR